MTAGRLAVDRRTRTSVAPKNSNLPGPLPGGLAFSGGLDHEQVVLRQDRATGLQAIIAVHSTALGPALGGLRYFDYGGSLSSAFEDALRLSHAMTLKAAAAGLELGGGKAVILDDGNESMRHLRLTKVAELIEDLAGRYITAEDVGTSTRDMDFLSQRTDHVVGRSEAAGGMGDPSPATAETVLGSIHAGLEASDGCSDLAGRVVAVIGLGKVGFELAVRLAAEGAILIAYDVRRDRAERLRAQTGCELARDAAELFRKRLDVLAPCAIGGTVDEELAGALDARVVAGSANNLVTGTKAAQRLFDRGIVYVPDFLANCGGLIQVDVERRGGGPEDVGSALDAATDRVRDILCAAQAADCTPLEIAKRRACKRLELARSARAAQGA